MSKLSALPYQGMAGGWNALVADIPGAHLLQTWEWAQVKQAFGWRMMPMIWTADDGKQIEAAAMILRRQILGRGFVQRLSVMYVPKGPLLDWRNEALRARVLEDLEIISRNEGAVLLKMDADIETGTGYPGQTGFQEDRIAESILEDMRRREWIYSQDQVQFRNTVMVDLTPNEDELLARLKQKTRYNMRLAEKKGVTVRLGNHEDIPALYRMYAATSARDGFVIRSAEYYQQVWETFLRPFTDELTPSAEVLIAQVEGEAVAAILVFYFARRAYYLYGMSRDVHREKMPNHLLQWQAIRRARALGCLTYDLWGAPESLDERDPLLGVYRFKEGFGGEVVRTAGAWDYPASRFWYPVYTRLVPRILDVMRARGRRQTRAALDAA